MTAPITPDPFEQTSVPAISWKDAEVGRTYTGVVTRAPELIRARDYDTGAPAEWPDGNPKMTVVLNMRVDGEVVSLWAPKPSAMFAAIADAQTLTKERMKVGDTLSVTFTGEKPNEKNPRLNPIKQYKVVITPGDPFAGENSTAASNGHAAPPAAPPAAPVPPVDPAQAQAMLTQIQGLIGFGLTDEQIRAAIPQASAEVLAAVRALPVG